MKRSHQLVANPDVESLADKWGLTEETSALGGRKACSPASSPTPLGDAAFHGLSGRAVRLIEPHSEADPAALLMQFHVAFGNVIGRSAHWRAEADRHHQNLFAVLVGETAKARKGTSWGQIGGIFKNVDAEWFEHRVMSGLASGEGLIEEVRDPIIENKPIRERGRIVGHEDVQTDPGVDDKR